MVRFWIMSTLLCVLITISNIRFPWGRIFLDESRVLPLGSVLGLMLTIPGAVVSGVFAGGTYAMTLHYDLLQIVTIASYGGLTAITILLAVIRALFRKGRGNVPLLSPKASR